MIRVGVVGAAGRMGEAVGRAVEADGSTQLAAQLDVDDPLSALTDSQVDVVVDFTVVEAARDTLRFAAANGLHAVVGTTGFTPEDLSEFGSLFIASNALIAPNFAIGAVLMIRMAELAAPHFDTAEIIEFHHDAKIDAPSGTAVHTAERMAAASSDWADDPTRSESIPGSRGASAAAEIRVHAVRMRGAVASQEVILGTTGQTLTIRHDTVDRTSFMPGVMLGIRRVAEFAGVTVGLDSYLGL